MSAASVTEYILALGWSWMNAAWITIGNTFYETSLSSVHTKDDNNKV